MQAGQADIGTVAGSSCVQQDSKPHKSWQGFCIALLVPHNFSSYVNRRHDSGCAAWGRGFASPCVAELVLRLSCLQQKS